jgi:hypothetical protein
LFYTSLEGRINGYQNRKFNFDWSKERERLQHISNVRKKFKTTRRKSRQKINKLMKKSLSYDIYKLKDSSSFAVLMRSWPVYDLASDKCFLTLEINMFFYLLKYFEAHRVLVLFLFFSLKKI